MKSINFTFFSLFFIISFLLTSCTRIKKEELIGEWKYTKYEFTNKSLEQPSDELIQDQQPSIIFHLDGKAEILSRGKKLSHGTFYLQNDIIRYEEVLEDGTKRKIPFLVKELSQTHLIFETMEDPIIRISAEKK